MSSLITESRSVQRPFIKYAEQVGWYYVSEEEALALRGGTQGKFFYEILEQNLTRLNPFLNPDDAQEIIRRIENISDTLEGNKQALDWLRGHETFYDTQEQRNRNVTLIDFANPENNEFHITEEWTHAGLSKKNRSDIMLLVNGIPLVVVETKNPKNKKAMEEAIEQFQRYERETPEMLCCPQVFNITNVREYFYGVTWNYSRKNIFNWKKELGNEKNWEKAVASFGDKTRFLRLIKQWVLFFYKEDKLQKTILQQHQIRAVEKIDVRCKEAEKTRGLIWHTQGSGKTFTMITAARVILERMPNATVMMIIDRQELEGQLAEWIDSLIRDKQQGINIRKAQNKKELQELLDLDFRGLIVSMIHKFNEIENNSCDREDFYVLIDEAHRSVNKDLGNDLMAALPKATLFGFTGTPIDRTSSGQGTFKIFGIHDKQGYLDKYSIQESIEDGTTLPLKYMGVSNELKLTEELLEEEFLQQAESEGVSDIEDLNEVIENAVKIKTFLKADDRVKKVAEYIVKHFKEKVPLGYKAFIVAVDREACALYKRALDKLLPHEMSQAIYSPGKNDSVILKKYLRKGKEEIQIRRSFKKAVDNPHILIVTDKLLTGYDAPILYCMYLDKPMRDHVLLQAIARVNRPYEGDKDKMKPCGLIVDFVGIFKSMEKALAFDSDEVNAVIEDLDRLFDKFKSYIDEDLGYLPFILTTKDDKLVEKLIYEDFGTLEKREKFIQKAKELETFYEVLSPDPRLKPYRLRYRNVIEVRRLLTMAYSGKAEEDETKFLGELSNKTEMLIRENSQVCQYKVNKTFDINTQTLEKLKKDNDSPEIVKIMNLIKSIVKKAEEGQDENPTLISIAERANDIVEKFKNRQLESKRCWKKLCESGEDIINSNRMHEELGLDKETFSIYWSLKEANIKDPEGLALEINDSFKKFENFNDSADEERQLRVEIYKILGSLIELDDQPKLVDNILRSMRKIDENR